jgi:putative Mg2+ transporter-C (MgtC) family protein
MPVNLQWDDVAIRLALTVVAGVLIGLNRQEHGRPAGMRTTVLVCLAASVSMIQANMLLGTVGKTSGSFVVMDLMRLPLGILSGMGFIGGGVILKRGNLVLGVTTAATLWFVTAMGLCFGGGQIQLGLILLALGLFVLWGLKRVEEWLPKEYRATFYLCIDADGPTEEEIEQRLCAEGFHIASRGIHLDRAASTCKLEMDVSWHARPLDKDIPPLVQELAKYPHVRDLKWSPQGKGISEF